MVDPVEQESVRIDKWLWAARFFKTRSEAARAVAGGKIELNGEVPKPAKAVRLGDRLRIRRGPELCEVVVRRMLERRGPASVAQTMYEETPESIQGRQELAARLRAERAAAPELPRGRPTKRDRRKLELFKRLWPSEE
jgi:ribosome-associated heat shock protein Hsp15